ncbi:MAG: hypothetical protein ACLFUL_00140 [Desulfobacteraceae bacterium]
MHLKRMVIWAIIGTGISSVVTQLLTIREFLTQFHGNEITISLVVFCWLLITALGTLAAKGVKPASPKCYGFMILGIAVWPLLQIIGIREFRELVFTHGVSPGFYPILAYIVITITPYCLMAGFVLPYSQHLLNVRGHPFDSGDLYVTDSIGDITGGVIFSFILVYWLKPFLIISLTSSFLIWLGIFMLFQWRGYVLLAAGLLVSMGFYLLSTSTHVERLTLTGQYGEIVDYTESPYGRIVISKEGPQYTLWQSGVPLYSDVNIISSEEKVHYPLCQLSRVDDILLVSGGLGLTLKEVAKYDPSRVDYLEIDPRLTLAAAQMGLIQRAPFLRIINTDARQYIQNTEKRYDAVIMDLPEPHTFQINRFFTDEFFASAKRILKEGGVFSLNMGYSSNYISEVQGKKISTIFNTAQKHFNHIMILPGEQAYFLMRDSALSADIPALLKEKAIPTAYIEGFFQGNVTAGRIEAIEQCLNPDEPVNTDFEPRLMNIVFTEWFSKYDTTPWYFISALLILTLVYLMFIRWEEYVLFSTGFVSMGMEMLVIFSFQVIFGYIYLEVGTIVTAFLLGLLPGALAGQRWGLGVGSKLVMTETLLHSMLLGFFVWIFWIRLGLHPWSFLGFCFVVSFFCGFQFPVVATLIGEKSSPAAGCLAADLWGAATGTLATGTVLIPFLGMKYTLFFLIFVKVSSSLLILLRYRSQIAV